MQLPSYRWRFVHLAALWGYGVSQPVFSMLEGNPEFLVVRGSSRVDVVVFALVLAFVPPLVVLAVEALASLASATLSGALHVVTVWAFAFVAVLQLTRLLDVDRVAGLALPVVPALVVVVLYVTVGVFRSFLSLSFVLPLLAVGGFVATVPLATDDAPAADVRVANPTPVVLVVLDELPVSSIMRPDGSLDAVRYPGFASLARSATWYRHATTVHEHTTQAVPAILTGIKPHEGELPTLADHPENIFTLLGRRYELETSEQVTRLCPTRYCHWTVALPPLVQRQRGLFFDAGVAYLHRAVPLALADTLPTIEGRWGGFGKASDLGARDRVLGAVDLSGWAHVAVEALGTQRAQFEGFVRSVEATNGRPQLYVEHLLLPHHPWRFLPSGRAYTDADIAGLDGGRMPARAPWLVNTALQRHLLQVQYTDRLLATLLARLEATGLYDRALVVVAADHGVCLRSDGSMRGVTRENLPDIAGVPLFVKYPGQRRGRIDERDAETIDIVPTIADVLGVRIPWQVDGVSLRAAPVRREVSVARDGGDPVLGDPELVEAGVLATARRNASLFGVGNDSMYRLGPFRMLYRQTIESLASYLVAAGTGGVELDDESAFANVRLSSGFVPARVAGELTGRVFEQGTALAIAINGRIEATTSSYVLGGRSQFEALVPESAFRDGRNSVRVYAVARTARAFRFESLGGTP